MSTVKQPLKYLWWASFDDGQMIAQPEDDSYSKHDDTQEHNPSSFRDILDYQERAGLESFGLSDRESDIFELNLKTGSVRLGEYYFKLDTEENIERKLIYFRNVRQEYNDGIAGEPWIESYSVGYEYKNKDGKTVKRLIHIDG